MIYTFTTDDRRTFTVPHEMQRTISFVMHDGVRMGLTGNPLEFCVRMVSKVYNLSHNDALSVVNYMIGTTA